jgi:hypothetical protein
MRVCLLLFCSLIATSYGASAATAQTSKQLTERAQGLHLAGSVGLNGCTGPRCQNLAPMIHTRLHPLYRINKYLAAGLHVGFFFMGPLFGNDGARTVLWDAMVGPEARGLFPVKGFDLWIAVAVGYFHREHKVTTDGFEHKIYANAIGLAWGVGLDYYVWKNRIAVGGDVWMYKGWNQRFCSRTGSNDAICSGEPNVDEGGGVSIAAGVSVTYFWAL